MASVEVLRENARGTLNHDDYWVGAAGVMNRLNKLITEHDGYEWESVEPDPYDEKQ